MYRDMGPSRSLRAVSDVLYGPRRPHGKRTVEGWSSRFDWVARVTALDDYHDMLRRDVVEEHARRTADELAGRREALRGKIFENEERAARMTERLLEHLEHSPLVVERWEEDENGTRIMHVTEPVLGVSFDLAASRLHKISASSQPQKIAPTDPTGEHEYGQDPEAIDREFDELLASAGIDAEEIDDADTNAE